MWATRATIAPKKSTPSYRAPACPPRTNSPSAGTATQITFYVDGQARKSLPTKQMGQWARLLFDVGPQANVSGSFDDVRITYAEK